MGFWTGKNTVGLKKSVHVKCYAVNDLMFILHLSTYWYSKHFTVMMTHPSIHLQTLDMFQSGFSVLLKDTWVRGQCTNPMVGGQPVLHTHLFKSTSEWLSYSSRENWHAFYHQPLPHKCSIWGRKAKCFLTRQFQWRKRVHPHIQSPSRSVWRAWTSILHVAS